jgi:transcriptional regulator GlxA family with amidase domain
MQSGRGSTANHATEQSGEWGALLNGHPALLRLRTWIAVNDPIRLTMRQAADLACVELHYFSAIFRKHTGRSFIEWRRSIRIARAAHLMSGGTLTVQQVVHAVGYKDRRSLERALKQLRNMTPGALRSREPAPSASPADATPAVAARRAVEDTRGR